MDEREALNIRLSEQVLERVAADPAYLEELIAQAQEYRRNYRQLREYLLASSAPENLPALPRGQTVDAPSMLRSLRQFQQLIGELIAERDIATIGVRLDVLHAYRRELGELLTNLHGAVNTSELRRLIVRLQQRGRLGARQRERYIQLAGMEELFIQRLGELDVAYARALTALGRLGITVPAATAGHYGELGEIQTAADLIYRRLEAIQMAYQQVREDAGWLYTLHDRVAQQIDILSGIVGMQEAPPLYDLPTVQERIDQLNKVAQQRMTEIVTEVGEPYGIFPRRLPARQRQRLEQLERLETELRTERLRVLERFTKATEGLVKQGVHGDAIKDLYRLIGQITQQKQGKRVFSSLLQQIEKDRLTFQPGVGLVRVKAGVAIQEGMREAVLAYLKTGHDLQVVQSQWARASREIARIRGQMFTGQLPPEAQEVLSARIQRDPALQYVLGELKRAKELRWQLVNDNRLRGYTSGDITRITEERQAGYLARRLIEEHERDLAMEEAIDLVDEARAVEPIDRRYGRELIRQQLNLLLGEPLTTYKINVAGYLAGRPIEEIVTEVPVTEQARQLYTPEWQELVGRRVTMRGEAVPFTVAAVDEQRRLARLQPAYLRPSQFRLTMRLAPGASTEEIINRWRKLEESSYLNDYEMPDLLARTPVPDERVISVLMPSGEGAAVEIRSLVNALSGLGVDADQDLEAIGRTLRQRILSHLPWLASMRNVPVEELPNIVWSALYRTLSESNIAVDWSSLELVNQALEGLSAQVMTTLRGRLLSNIIEEVYSGSSSANNVIRDLLSYIQEQHNLSYNLAVDALYRVKEHLRSTGAFEPGGGVHHLRFLVPMTRREIAQYGAANVELDKLAEVARHNLAEEEVRGWFSGQSVLDLGLTTETAEQMLTTREPVVEGVGGPVDEPVAVVEAAEDFAESRRAVRELRLQAMQAARRQDWPEFQRIVNQLLREHLTSWEEHKGVLRRLLSLPNVIQMLAGSKQGLRLRTGELSVLRGILEDVRKLGGAVRLEAQIGRNEPVDLHIGTRGDLIAERLRTGERYIVAEQPPAPIHIPLTRNPEDEVQLLQNIAARKLPFTPTDKTAVLVRELGHSWEQLATRQTPAGPVFLGISPDVMLGEFERLRQRLQGEEIHHVGDLVAIDWETTTLLDRLPEIVPEGVEREELFHPTEVAVQKATLSGFSGRPSIEVTETVHILFKPSPAVRETAQHLLGLLSANPSVLELWNNHRRTQELDFLRNIARYSPVQGTGRGAAWIAELGQPLVPQRLTALREDVEQGLAHLSERGVPLAQGMEELARHIEQAPLILGQNYLNADLAWYNVFARRAGITPHPARPLIDLEVLSRHFFPHAPSHSLTRQLERLNLAEFAGQQHYAAADVELYFRALERYFRIPHPIGTDLRPVQPGDYVARVRVPAVPGAVVSTEEGRPVRGVYRVADINAGDLQRITMTLVPYGEHHPHTQPVVEELGDLLTASRRFHTQFAVLSGEEEAAILAEEFFQDRVRREVNRAIYSPRRLKELYLYQQGVAQPTLELQSRYREALEYLRAGKELTPAEEFLLRQYREADKEDVANRAGLARAYGIFDPEVTRAEELGTVYRPARRQALDEAAKWLTSPEGQAHLTFVRELEGLMQTGLVTSQDLPEELQRNPASTLIRRFNELKRELAGVRRVPRLWAYDLGIPTIHGQELGRPVVITARNPEYIYRGLTGYARRVIGRAFPTLREEERQAELLRHLRMRGFVSEQVSNLRQAAAELFVARGTGRLPQYMVEYSPQPVITTAQDAEALLNLAREEILAPLLGVAERESYAAALQRRMAERPVAAAKFARMRQIREELGSLAESPLLQWSQVTSGIEEGLSFPSTGTHNLEIALQPTSELITRVSTGIRRLQLPNPPDLYSDEEFQAARRRLIELAMAGDQEAVEFLGWSEEAARAGHTLIPLYTPGLRGTYLRRLSEVAPEDIKALGNVMERYQRYWPARLARYVSIYQEQLTEPSPATETPTTSANPAREGIRRMNETIRETAGSAPPPHPSGGTSPPVTPGGALTREAGWIRRFTPQSMLLAAGIGASLLTALALVRPYDKRKATEERAYVEGKQNLPVAEPTNQQILPVTGPASTRLEETGAGVRIAIKGRSRQKIDQQELAASINAAVAREVPQANINLRLSDRRQSINEESLRQMFGQLLRYGYVG